MKFQMNGKQVVKEKKKMRKELNKLTMLILTLVMIVTTMYVPTITSEAAGTKTTVDYDNTYDIQKYWSGKKTPVKEGYVFGGWYEKNGEEYEPLVESKITENTTGAYAKFVPAYVLSVKAQIESGIKAGDGAATAIRFLSSVDSMDYRNVGFDIWLNNKTEFKTDAMTTVYSGIKAKETDADKDALLPGDVFGSASTRFSIVRLTKILDKHDSLIIRVRPYWTTLDGTKVSGETRYIRVEDGYLNYVSIPVNLHTGNAIAAGLVELSYDKSVLEFVEFDAGTLLSDMQYNSSPVFGKVRFVGNAVKDTTVMADGIFANVRFKLKRELAVGEKLQFGISNQNFCNWQKVTVDAGAWDFQY